MRKAILLGAAALLATVSMARADGPNPVEIRQTGFDLLSANFAGIRAVAAAKGDVKTMEASAKAIVRFAALLPALFPAGSDKGETKAKPEIWSDNAGFMKAAAAMGAAAEKLAALAKAGDADGFAAQVKEVGAACGACHKEYRQK